MEERVVAYREKWGGKREKKLAKISKLTVDEGNEIAKSSYGKTPNQKKIEKITKKITALTHDIAILDLALASLDTITIASTQSA